MVKLVYGDRIAKDAKLRTNANAIIFDESREKVLLIQRSDNNSWCIPGGTMDPGESAEETCVREALEETGLEVRVTRLIGIYTSPNMIASYEDGNRWQSIGMSFEAEITGGKLQTNDEALDFGYFSIESVGDLSLFGNQVELIQDAISNLPSAIIK